MRNGIYNELKKRRLLTERNFPMHYLIKKNLHLDEIRHICFQRITLFLATSIFQPSQSIGLGEPDDRIENVLQHVRNPDEYRVAIGQDGIDYAELFAEHRLIPLKE